MLRAVHDRRTAIAGRCGDSQAELIASEIRHEDDLIGQRTIGLVISPSFLFGTFAAVNGQLGG
jgi:hypothetical protein